MKIKTQKKGISHFKFLQIRVEAATEIYCELQPHTENSLGD